MLLMAKFSLLVLWMRIKDHDLPYGHKIQRGFTCVKITNIKDSSVPAPVILGDPEENSHPQKGMYFDLPIAKLFKCEKYIAGDKVVLCPYHISKRRC